MGDAYDMWRNRYGLDDALEPLIEKYVTEITAETGRKDEEAGSISLLRRFGHTRKQRL
jgi:hypothetical protein